MEPNIRVDIVEKLYAAAPAARPFLDPELPVEVPTSAKHQQADAGMRTHQRDMGIIAHALTTCLEDLEGASTHLTSAITEWHP